MIVKTEAIVLHSVKVGDQRLIVDMFTREQGRLSFAVPLQRGAHARFRMQFFQPLTLLSLECDVRPQWQVHKLTDVSFLQPPASLLTVPSKLAISLFIAEFLYHALRDEQSNAPLFDYVKASIAWLDGSADHYANFHLVFLMRLSRFLGFFPNLHDDGPYFDLRAATFCSEPPVHRDFLMPQEATHIRVLMRMDFPTMHLYRLSRSERQRILEVQLFYYRIHLPSFPELRSVAVLQALYD